jgi:hypothetical protein
MEKAKQHTKNSAAWYLLPTLLLLAAGCGGGSSGDGGDDNNVDGSGTAVITPADMARAVQVNDDAISGGVARLVSEEGGSITVTCALGGTASFTGDRAGGLTPLDRDFSITGTVTFDECNSYSGEAAVDANGTVGRDEVTVSATYNGRISDVCFITFNDITQETAFDRRTWTGTTTISGTATGTCEGMTINCSWSSVNITDDAALAAGCA